MKGGYVIADFKNTALTSGTEATISGVYDAIEAAAEYNKPVLVSGLVVGSVVYPAMYVNFTISSSIAAGNAEAGSADIAFSIDGTDDGVTVTVS